MISLDSLHRTAQAAISGALNAGEKLLVVIPGEIKSAMVATDRRVFVFKAGVTSGRAFSKQLNSWDYVNISGVEVRKGMTTLAIVLQVPGVTPVTKYGRMDKGPASVWEAPNALMTSAKGAETVVGTIRQRIADSQRPATPVAVAQPAAADPATQLSQLADLRDKGILSEDEFQAMKARIVAANSAG